MGKKRFALPFAVLSYYKILEILKKKKKHYICRNICARSGPQLFRFETPALWFFVRLRNHGLGFCVPIALIASFQKWFVFLERSNSHDSTSDTIDWPLSGIIDWPLSGMQAVVVYLYADHSVLYVSILTLQFTAKDSSTCFYMFEFRFLLTLI